MGVIGYNIMGKPMGKPPKRRKVIYGQNFLINEAVARNIVDSCGFSINDNVLEIGPGEGILTGLIVGNTKTYTMLEIDPFYYSFIKGKFNLNKFGGINVLNMDALKFDYIGLSRSLSSRIRVVSNLPYEISGPVMEKFIKEKDAFSDLTLMFQKEFARRLYAKENDRERGALSVIADINFEIIELLEASKSDFNPVPKVDSTVLKIIPKYHADDNYLWAVNSSFFNYFVRQIFKLRRKKLKNSIYASFFGIPSDIKEKVFAEVNIDLDKRPQELTTTEFVKAAKKYDDYLKTAEKRYNKRRL
ncbi:MAG: 16S rRNA (adenine(1518)-N(6)/adenine(1519)-N(6))-dimethyltransferase RsmA [Deltaproteobacteria bacterium]|nr:16S rRNA (adenine(1518)-N(6)/adenine(1519)-N(6))-dimethyltransferase RsmA [Deltaproteobacteria bacterium]